MRKPNAPPSAAKNKPRQAARAKTQKRGGRKEASNLPSPTPIRVSAWNGAPPEGRRTHPPPNYTRPACTREATFKRNALREMNPVASFWL
jgi:hypothetical protein